MGSRVQADSVDLQRVDPDLVVGGEEGGRAGTGDTGEHLSSGTTLTATNTLTHGRAGSRLRRKGRREETLLYSDTLTERSGGEDRRFSL